MLVDVRFSQPDFAMGLVLGIIGAGNGPVAPERIERGFYRCGHWSVDQLIPGLDPFPDDLPAECYGVCDSPEQFKRQVDCESWDVPVFVTFVHLKRANQPLEGGWRWHKWGPYIGEKSPQCEYLHDEPDIEEIYTFHIYKAPAERIIA